jgi:segregation and condensation protein B
VNDEVPEEQKTEDAETGERREAAQAVMAVVEAMLYAAGKPVSVEKMAEAADLPQETIEDAVLLLEEACAGLHRGVMLDRVAGGIRFVSRPEHDDSIRTLLGLDGRTKLTMAALETLAIIAYRQPITAPDIAELRGVLSATSLRTLLDRKLVTTAGRKEVVGTPFLYKTTKEFLVHFGLGEIAELPKPEELEALYGIETPGKPDDGQKELFSPEETEALVEPEEGEPSAAGSAPGDNTEETAGEAPVAPEE